MSAERCPYCSQPRGAPHHDAVDLSSLRWVRGDETRYVIVQPVWLVTCFKATPDQPRQVQHEDGQTVIWVRVLEADEDD